MSEIEIKIALLKKGISQTAIAEALVAKGYAGTEASHVSGVIKGNRTTLHIRKAIAKAVGKRLHDVFPDEKYRRPSGRIVKRQEFVA